MSEAAVTERGASAKLRALDLDTIHVGELEIQRNEGLALARGEALALSAREFSLLVALAQRSGRILTREQLYGAVWGGALRHGDRSVDVYVSKLRRKLERVLPDRRFIHTHAGFGYRLHPQPSRNLHSEQLDERQTPVGRRAEAAASAGRRHQ